MSSAAPVQLRGRAVVWGGLCLLLLFHLVSNCWWLAADRHPVMSDESLHMNCAREYYAVLSDRSLPWVSRGIEIFNAQSYYPPLLHLTAATLMLATHYGPDIIAFTDTLIFLLIILASYALSRLVLPRRHALFAAFVVSFTPLLYGASRNFMTDYPSALFAPLAVYCLIRSNFFRHTGWVFWFALANAGGIMTRQTTVVFYLAPAVFVVGGGLVKAAFVEKDRETLKQVVLNAAIALLISAGLAAPWHLHHFEFLRRFWATQFYSGRGVFDDFVSQLHYGWLLLYGFAAAALAGIVYLSSRAFYRRWHHARPHLAPKLRLFLAAAAVAAVLLVLALSGRWSTYAFFLIQDGVFLPLFLLGLAGLAIGLSLRGRNVPLVVIVLWVGASYILLTLLFNSRVPRYFLPATPGLAILAAYALTVIPRPRLRIAAMAGLAGILLVTYANMTFARLGPLGHVAVGPLLDSPRVSMLLREPLPLWKDHIIAGDYAFHPARREAAYVERMMSAMIEDMRTRRPIYEALAQYQLLTDQKQFEGFWFVEEHYADDSNPYRVSSLPEASRPLRVVGNRWQQEPEELLSLLDLTDFVLIKVGVADDVMARWHEKALPEDEARVRVAEWTRFFKQRDFTPVTRFYERRYNSQPGGFYVVLGRELAKRTPVRRWDFSQLPQERWQWVFDGGARKTPQGALRISNKSGPAMVLSDADFRAEEVDAVRLAMQLYQRDGRGKPVQPEQMHFYWARPGDYQPEEWPFSPERGVPFRRTGEHTYEAVPARHSAWSGNIEQCMIGVDLPALTPELAEPVKTWEFTADSTAEWEWQFAKGVEKAPLGLGALKMMRDGGPLMSLARTIDTAEVDLLEIKVETLRTTPRENLPAMLKGGAVYWTAPEHEASGAAYDDTRTVPLTPSAEDPETWYAVLSSHNAWRGEVSGLLVTVDLPEAVLRDPNEHFSLLVKSAKLLSARTQDDEAPGAVNMLLDEITLLK